MRIRKAKPEDKRGFIKIAKEADQRPEYWSGKKFSKFVSNKDCLFLFAEENNKILGYVGLIKKDEDKRVKKIDFDKYSAIAWIAVSPTCRKKRVGSKLLKSCEKYAKKWKKKGVWLDCRKDLVDFYKKNGYKIKGFFMKENKQKRLRKFYLMIKELR